MDRNDIVYILFVLVFISPLILLGVENFNHLQEDIQEENLRWLSSALIQAHAAILAVVPTISLTLISFFASKYPSRLAKSYWKNLEWPVFFLLMCSSIAMCYFVLVSIPYVPKEIVIPFLGTPLEPFNSLGDYLYVDIFSILFSFLAVYVLIKLISGLTSIEKIFQNLKEDMLKNGRKFSISSIFGKKLVEKDQLLEDYFSLMASLAESRNLTGLRVGVEIIFELLIKDDKYHDKVTKMLGDISTRYLENKEKFCFERVEEMVGNGHRRIVKAFYRKQIKERGYTWGMDPLGTEQLILRIHENLEEDELQEMEPSESTFFFKMSSFMFDTWEYMSRLQYSPSRKKKFIGVISRALFKFVSRASEKEMEKTDTELQAFLRQREKFEESLNEEATYLQEYRREFLDVLSIKCKSFNAEKEITILHILCKELRKRKMISSQ